MPAKHNHEKTLRAEADEAAMIAAACNQHADPDVRAKGERLARMVAACLAGADALAGRRLRAPETACEHGVRDGDWCEPCNRAYKQAAREHGYAEPTTVAQENALPVPLPADGGDGGRE